LDIHDRVHYSPAFVPYRWYHRGIGSFHAFFAASVLIAIMAKTGEINQSSQYRMAVNNCLQRLEELSERSPISAKAVPVLKYLLKQHRVKQPSLSSFSPSASGSETRLDLVPGFETGIGDNMWMNDPQFGGFLTQVSSEQWLSPSTFSWDIWDPAILDMDTTQQSTEFPVLPTITRTLDPGSGGV